ncbi:zinc ABC transporter substrate-binding protein [Alsobacter sp. SYSU M60028]|uniref:Zinc ABC transporter substrate-binding protein n=1 Tax=Alsobacter ponti TaxID=2962936 RepID=A0ABT1LE01_9HYPH|nr:zinc ABC transporter substrate-binding protein [Alsobacter ponti]MCP8939727.1 zinc ABC transporter substrate-binding protein [Alsobacter ponti]
MIRRRLVLAAGLSLLAFAADGTGARAADRVPVVASFSILGDFVREVGGDRADVTELVGPNADAHVYQPSAADARRLAAARLVVVNGLGFEGWMDRLVKASGTSAAMVTAASSVAPLTLEAGDGHAHGADGRPSPDPHAWQDARNARLYVAAIRDGLTGVDPAGAEYYRARADAYLARLDALDAEIRAAVARIPEDRRRVVTSHDAFAYFGRAYGLAFIAPQGVSTDAEASARDVARIIRQIRAEKIPAVFLENVTDPRLVERITRETGARIGGRLWSDALSARDGPAGTYIEMMRSNIRELTSALAG